MAETQYLLQALTHPTYAFEHSGCGGDYERLEYLGDAVLELAVSDFLYKRSQDLPEGQMTKIRASLVREETLAKLARELDLGPYLLLGHGEDLTGGRNKDSNLANAFEALLAALYLNWGFAKTLAWLEGKMGKLLEQALAGELLSDYKSKLLEQAQAAHQVDLLEFSVSHVSGPVHKPVFSAVIYLAGEKVAEGRGKSKKQAEQAAAKEALAINKLFDR
ncbi:MAG: ribonuclease III [Eubacteriales bacterium]|nr:ribonuclease III [Eubacteriales bacterium]